MSLDLTYTDVVLVRFGNQILHGTIDILHKCWMQRHGITFQHTSTTLTYNKKWKEKQSYKFKFDIKKEKNIWTKQQEEWRRKRSLMLLMTISIKYLIKISNKQKHYFYYNSLLCWARGWFFCNVENSNWDIKKESVL